jgi:hypothetical protein
MHPSRGRRGRIRFPFTTSPDRGTTAESWRDTPTRCRGGFISASRMAADRCGGRAWRRGSRAGARSPLSDRTIHSAAASSTGSITWMPGSAPVAVQHDGSTGISAEIPGLQWRLCVAERPGHRACSIRASARQRELLPVRDRGRRQSPADTTYWRHRRGAWASGVRCATGVSSTDHQIGDQIGIGRRSMPRPGRFQV